MMKNVKKKFLKRIKDVQVYEEYDEYMVFLCLVFFAG